MPRTYKGGPPSRRWQQCHAGVTAAYEQIASVAVAKVDFGAWSVSEAARSEVEAQAAKLPHDWTITLGMKADASRTITVLVEGDPSDSQSHFDFGRFDLVAEFLASLARHIGR